MAGGHIVTCQTSAWNDTTRMMMYTDLILKKASDEAISRHHFVRGNKWSSGRKIFLWMDGFSAHKGEDISRVMKNAEVEVAFYPPNMTGYLQVLDLVVNKTIKEKCRLIRGAEIADAFKTFKAWIMSKKKGRIHEGYASFREIQAESPTTS